MCAEIQLRIPVVNTLQAMGYSLAYAHKPLLHSLTNKLSCGIKYILMYRRNHPLTSNELGVVCYR